MRKEKDKPIIPRLPAEAVEVLRKKGGTHKPKKGKGSYSRGSNAKKSLLLKDAD